MTDKTLTTPEGRTPRTSLIFLILSLVLAMLAGPATAVTINIIKNPTSVAPPWDPNRDNLDPIIQAAADYWEDIIRDPGVIDIYYHYQPINDTRVAWSCFAPNLSSCHDNVQLGSIPNLALIAFDTTVQWYFDPTPTNHSEFDLQQTLARDVANVGFIFDGSVPDLLEVSFTGPALPSAPGNALSNFDAFTVALHEIGHVLGAMLNETAWNETGDNDYDIDPSFVDNAVISARIWGGTDGEHLQIAGSLMDSTIGTGIRSIPSATDVFAVAAVPGWQDIHLPRREFWGGLAYQPDENWSGHSTPDSSDDVWVRWGNATGLNTATEARNLTISDDTTLLTTGSDLQVLGMTTIEQGEGTHAALDINSDVLSTGVLVRDGGTVALFNGQLTSWLIETEAGGTFVSDGSADNVTALAFYNGGTLSTAGSGQLTIDTLPDLIDLDGPSDSGGVEALDGDLRLQDGLTDPFDGVMTVGFRSTVDIAEPWTLASGGQLILAGGLGGDQARIQGGEVALQGLLDVSGHGRISAPVTITSGATVTVAADSELQLQWLTELAGGSYTGDGTIRLNGPTSVTLPTVLATNSVDLDGSSGNTQIDLTRSLTLQVDTIDFGNSIFDGTINVQGWLASLGVFLTDPLDSWVMDGVLDLSGIHLWPTTQLTGSDVVIDGTLNVDGWSRSNANIELRGNLSTTDIDTRLHLNSSGVNIFRDTTSVAGAGWVVVDDSAELQLEAGFDELLRLENAGTVVAGVGPGANIAMPRVLFYTQVTTGDLELEIGGPTVGVDHDRLQSIGNANLAGGLRVSLVNGFAPQLGDSFTIVTTSFGFVIGTFDTTTLPALGRRLQWNVVYGLNTVRLDVTASP